MLDRLHVPRWLHLSLELWSRGGIWTRARPLGALGASVMLSTVVVAVFAPFLAGSPHYMRFDERLVPPSLEYPLGTDGLGRDILARIVYGARVEVVVGLAVLMLGASVGGLVGLVSGFFGGLVDDVLQRVVDALMALPLLVLGLSIVAVLGPSLLSVVIAISIPIAARAARLIRAVVLRTKESEFVTAARALGAGPWWVLVVHVAPHTLSTFLVGAAAWLSTVILAEAALSYLGFGPAPPFVSWGQMLSSDAAPYMRSAPWTAIFPGMAITLLVYAVNMLGDAIRDMTDPRVAAGGKSPIAARTDLGARLKPSVASRSQT